MKTNLKRSLNGLYSYALPVPQLSQIKGGNTEIVSPETKTQVVEDGLEI